MVNKAFYPPLTAEKAGPKVIRFVYKKPRLVVFFCPLIHTNKIVTNQPPNIAKIRTGGRPRLVPDSAWLLIEQENQHDYHISLPAKRTAYNFLLPCGAILSDRLRKTAKPWPVWTDQRLR